MISQRRGGPLVMLCLLLGVWVTARAAMWESPFTSLTLPPAELFFAEETSDQFDLPAVSADPARVAALNDAEAIIGHSSGPENPWVRPGLMSIGQHSDAESEAVYGTDPIIAAGHSFLMAAAFRVDWPGSSNSGAQSARSDRGNGTSFSPISPVAPPLRGLDRWSLDTFAFYRQGSGSTAISQGRVPVYGASQVSANLQYRLAPSSRRDPRAYVRVYRAFVPDGENEVAAGLSIRPVEAVPARVAAELRVTENRFGTEVRPAAYAVTELPVVRLPFDIRAEAYAGAGYVGGSADTPFVDGQASITRELARVERSDDRSVRLSIGGGAWGGAQKDANRLDIGPSARLDLTIGRVPARISVDWRERVAGDAEPNSGIAATLSTRF